jgi:hypothetical protein
MKKINQNEYMQGFHLPQVEATEEMGEHSFCLGSNLSSNSKRGD